MSSGGTAIVTTIVNGGYGYVESGGTAVSTTVSSGGFEEVFTGGTASATSVISSEMYVLGSAISTTVHGAGRQVVNLGGTTTSTTVSSGGAEYVFIGGTASLTTVSGGGFEVVSGGTAIGTTVSSGGAVDLWVTNGTQVSSTAFVGSVGPNSGWTIQGVGDFTGDGNADILWQNSTTGAVNLWEMDGSTIVSNDYISAVTPSSDWKMQFLGDFNGDGKTDILWQNSATGAVDLWIMNGSTITSNDFVGSVGPNSDWTIQGVGDYASNGNTDILWRNSTTGAADLWLMNGTQISSNAYVGTVDNSWQIQHA